MNATERRSLITREAAEWWVQMHAEEVPRKIREQYVDWLRESPVHVAEMLRIAQVHETLEHFSRWSRVAADTETVSDSNVVRLSSNMHQPFISSPGAFQKFQNWTIAAGVGLLVVTMSWFQLSKGIQVIATERGERREVALSDGSTVRIDPGSRLRVKFSADAREIWLDHGRALFRVAKIPDRPFEVHADNTLLRAVGTAFGVDRQSAGIVVTVAEGKIAVIQSASEKDFAQRGRGSPRLSTAGEGRISYGSVGRNEASTIGPELFLVAGQQVTLRKFGSEESPRKIDSSRALAWAQGRLVFENDRVSSVVEQFNRFNRIQIHVVGEALAARPVSGVFDSLDPESFVAFMQSAADVQVERSEADLIMISLH